MPLLYRAAVLLLSLAGVWPLAAVAAEGDATVGQTIFKTQCGICHSPLQGKNMVGPSLFGVVGRDAGTVQGFHYSAANRNSGITWTPEELGKYLTSPKAVVPGTIMTFPGLPDAEARADVIAYLETLH